ncbi:hypothetical protein RB601_003923 [Gaeumannomyces tritici]
MDHKSPTSKLLARSPASGSGSDLVAPKENVPTPLAPEPPRPWPRRNVWSHLPTDGSPIPLASASVKTPTLKFLSDQQKISAPSLDWGTFARPKLRKYHAESSSLIVESAIGGGVDGMVFLARTANDEKVAVKIFFDFEQPNPVRQPWGWSYYYWAFKRECQNCAILELISASLTQASARKLPIHLNPNPTTWNDAIRNLKAFSDTHADEYRAYPGFAPFQPDGVHINDCLGWLHLDAKTVFQVFKNHTHFRVGIKPEPKRRKKTNDEPRWVGYQPWFFAIVYAFVPEGNLQKDVIQSSQNLFHMAGFINLPYNPMNWRGSGVLVDHSDIIGLMEKGKEWTESCYAHEARTKNTVKGLEM